ncbi:MAG: hypothetical protein HWE21_09310 [Cytophagia bacterium]|nr:hypothetical protein [Cytophagia bacterium]
MKRLTLTQLKNICLSIRESIELNKSKTNLFKEFPQGCCRDASLIVGIILKKMGAIELVYCRRDFDLHYKSHAWLEYNSFIIDITADQFDTTIPNVIVSRTPIMPFHQKQHEEPLTFSIAGMDAIDLLKDMEIIEGALSPKFSS